MRDFKDALTVLAVATIVIGAIGLGVYTEYSVWNECRLSNSWLYCVRTMSRG